MALWAFIYKKLGKKDSDSSSDGKKASKKHGSNKSHTSRLPSARRKNGKVRARRVDSESSESEFEKKDGEDGDHKVVKSNGVGRAGRLESVDESEAEQSSGKESSCPASPSKNGDEKKQVVKLLRRRKKSQTVRQHGTRKETRRSLVVMLVRQRKKKRKRKKLN